MKRYRIPLFLLAIFTALIAVYATTPSWRIYWNTRSGKQRSARCLFGFPIAYEKTRETALSERLDLKDSDDGEWVTVASGRPFEMALISWCYSRVKSVLDHAEMAVTLARISSDHYVGQEDDSRRIALQFIREFEVSHNLCRVNHQLHKFSEELLERDFTIRPFRSEELDQIFTDRPRH